MEWSRLIGEYPRYLILFCTALTVVIPYTIYKINRAMHELGDPPWKKEEHKLNEKLYRERKRKAKH